MKTFILVDCDGVNTETKEFKNFYEVKDYLLQKYKCKFSLVFNKIKNKKMFMSNYEKKEGDEFVSEVEDFAEQLKQLIVDEVLDEGV